MLLLPRFSDRGIHHTHEWSDKYQIMVCRPPKKKLVTLFRNVFLNMLIYQHHGMPLLPGYFDKSRIEDKPKPVKKFVSEFDKVSEWNAKQYDKIDPEAGDAFDQYCALSYMTSLKYYNICVKEGREPSPSMMQVHKGQQIYEKGLCLALMSMSNEPQYKDSNVQ
jgi:hypothetical protein